MSWKLGHKGRNKEGPKGEALEATRKFQQPKAWLLPRAKRIQQRFHIMLYMSQSFWKMSCFKDLPYLNRSFFSPVEKEAETCYCIGGHRRHFSVRSGMS